jgi:hypothetical protein
MFGFLLDLFFDPEDGGDMYLHKVSSSSTDYMTLYPTRQTSSLTILHQAVIEDVLAI